jgi:hypothetical protein
MKLLYTPCKDLKRSLILRSNKCSMDAISLLRLLAHLFKKRDGNMFIYGLGKTRVYFVQKNT